MLQMRSRKIQQLAFQLNLQLWMRPTSQSTASLMYVARRQSKIINTLVDRIEGGTFADIAIKPKRLFPRVRARLS